MSVAGRTRLSLVLYSVCKKDKHNKQGDEKWAGAYTERTQHLSESMCNGKPRVWQAGCSWRSAVSRGFKLIIMSPLNNRLSLPRQILGVAITARGPAFPVHLRPEKRQIMVSDDH